MGRLAPVLLFFAGLVALVVLSVVGSNPGLGYAIVGIAGLCGVVAFVAWLLNFNADAAARRATFQQTAPQPPVLASTKEPSFLPSPLPTEYTLAKRIALNLLRQQWGSGGSGTVWSKDAFLRQYAGVSGGGSYQRAAAQVEAWLRELDAAGRLIVDDKPPAPAPVRTRQSRRAKTAE